MACPGAAAASRPPAAAAAVDTAENVSRSVLAGVPAESVACMDCSHDPVAQPALPPLVSLIMPMHNAADTLEETLNSVHQQTHRPLELSVYNDASTDDSMLVLSRMIPHLTRSGVKVIVNSGELMGFRIIVDPPACSSVEMKKSGSNHAGTRKRNRCRSRSRSSSSSPNRRLRKLFKHGPSSSSPLSTPAASDAATSDFAAAAAAAAASVVDSGSNSHSNSPQSNACVAGAGGGGGGGIEDVATPRGPGFARDVAVAQASGKYIAWLDADDVMENDRIERQVCHMSKLDSDDCGNLLVGGNFSRIPEGSQERYTAQLNGLTQSQLYTRRFRKLTLIQPTWLMSRSRFLSLGGYGNTAKLGDPAAGKGEAEDLVLFFRHLQAGGRVTKVEGRPVLRYRFSPDSVSSRTPWRTLMELRVAHLEQVVLGTANEASDASVDMDNRIEKSEEDPVVSWRSHKNFMIAGFRDARRVFNCMSQHNRDRVSAFLDIAPNRVGTIYVDPRTGRKIPILAWDNLQLPFLAAVALDRGDGSFAQTLKELNAVEGKDYIHVA